jgi:hypothetical protein
MMDAFEFLLSRISVPSVRLSLRTAEGIGLSASVALGQSEKFAAIALAQNQPSVPR